MTDTSISKEQVDSLLNEAYNLGIEHSRAIVKVYGDSHWKLTEPSLMSEDIDKQLEALKKKQP